MQIDGKTLWEQKINKELPIIEALVLDLGYKLDAIQPNLMGEKFLMKVDKFILSATRIKDNKKVIIKISKDKAGIKEIKNDRAASQNLKNLSFAKDTIKVAEEIFFKKVGDYQVYIVEFLEQKDSLMKLPLEEQFYITLRAFDILENIYLSTKEHKKLVKDKFPILKAEDYLKRFLKYRDDINKILNDPEVNEKVSFAKNVFKQNLDIVKKFENFLVHEDFVQQNFRLQNGVLYFIDHEALQFGNLYETQARFLNFMMVHSPKLEKKYLEYFKQQNRPDKELALRMMRLFKCTQLLDYYAKSLEKSRGNEYKLSKVRFDFYLDVLENLSNNTPVHDSLVTEYENTRNSLRSKEEVERQKLIKHL